MSGSMDIMNEDKMITAATVHQIHKVLRSCFRQAVKWEMMDKNPAIDATLPKYKAEEREIWTAEMHREWRMRLITGKISIRR